MMGFLLYIHLSVEDKEYKSFQQNVNKPVDKKKKPLKGPRIVGYIVRK